MKMRPFNKAPFTISKFLSSGAPLPKMTFCRLRFYSQKQVSFDGTSVGKAQRVLIPNSIADQWLHGMQDTNPQGGTWLYLDVFKTFYRYYLCLGSKTKITIQRMLYLISCRLLRRPLHSRPLIRCFVPPPWGIGMSDAIISATANK